MAQAPQEDRVKQIVEHILVHINASDHLPIDQDSQTPGVAVRAAFVRDMLSGFTNDNRILTHAELAIEFSAATIVAGIQAVLLTETIADEADDAHLPKVFWSILERYTGGKDDLPFAIPT